MIAEIFKAPINFIISGINVFIRGLNKIKIPNWVPVVGGKGINIKEIPKLRIGLDYVPYDEYPAMLHKGEQVLTASEREEYQHLKQQAREGSKSQQQTVNVEVSINIDSFNNNTDQDVKDLTDEVMHEIEEKIKRKGVVFA